MRSMLVVSLLVAGVLAAAWPLSAEAKRGHSKASFQELHISKLLEKSSVKAFDKSSPKGAMAPKSGSVGSASPQSGRR
jgi:hypothetical protein